MLMARGGGNFFFTTPSSRDSGLSEAPDPFPGSVCARSLEEKEPVRGLGDDEGTLKGDDMTLRPN